MTDVQFKACPRCTGDLFLEQDEYDWNWTCLQCGYRQILKEKPIIEKDETLTKTAELCSEGV